MIFYSHTEQEKHNVKNQLLGRIQFWIHIWLISAFSSRSLIRFLLIHNLQSQLNLSLKPTYKVAPINQALGKMARWNDINNPFYQNTAL